MEVMHAMSSQDNPSRKAKIALYSYYPGRHMLMPVGRHANERLTPAAKSVAVRIVA
jgi:hypothetical protein